jgi:hypothetical protein
MPYIRNKIIINDGVLLSFWFIVKGWLKGIGVVMEKGEFLAEEIEENGWLLEPDAIDFLHDQENDCAVIDAACHLFITQLADYHKKQMIRNDAMRLWVDAKLQQKQP